MNIIILLWGFILKLNKLILVSIFLLAIISLGAVSAADDITAEDKLAVETNGEVDVDLDTTSIDEISSDSDVKGDVAVGDGVKNDVNSKLGASQDDVLKDKVDPTYTIDTKEIKYGQVENVTVTIPNATGIVNITCNNVVYSGTLVNGVFTQPITNYVINNNKLTVEYFGDENFNAFKNTAKSFRTSFDVKVHDANFGQVAFIEINLYDATGTVTFDLNNGQVVEDVALVNGSIIKEYKKYVVFRNSIVATYNGDDRFNSNRVTSNNFQARPIITAPTIYDGQVAVVTVNLGEATGIVNVTFNGVTTECPLVKGIATFETTDYVIGNNKFTYSYSGDDTFKAFDDQNYNAKFDVLDKQNSTIYSVVYKTPEKNVIAIAIPYSNGTVNITINGKEDVYELVDGEVEIPLGADEEVSEIKVNYTGNYRLNPGNSTGFVVLENNIVNADTYMYYFDQVRAGKIFNFIPACSTLDFQGSIINPDQENMIWFDVSKPMNIISTTNDAYIDLNTTAGSLMGEDPGNRFTISKGGSGSNVTGINFHNTQLWITNTSHVVLDRISNVIEDQRVGSGVGATSIRDGSTWVTVKNSYFYTRNNGGSSSLVIAWADYCTFHNNTIKVEGNVGNMIYLTTYNVEIPEGVVPNKHNNITYNKIFGPAKAASICWGFVVAGSDNLFANNWINYTGIGFTAQWGAGAVDANVYVNNTLIGGASATFPTGSIAYNNYISGTMNTGANSVVYNNTVGKAMTVAAGAEAYNNTAGGLTMSGAEGVAHDNIINGATTISATGVEVYDNTFEGDNLIKFSNANAKNGIFANNTVVGSIEISHRNAKNNTITGNNITTSKNYAIDLKSNTGTETVITDNILNSAKGFGDAAINHKEDSTLVIDNYQDAEAEISAVAEDIKVGQNAVFTVNVNETSMTNAIIVIGGKEYTVNLVDGKGTVEVSGLAAGNYDVDVVSADKNFGGRNSTTLTVTKNDIEIVVDAPDTIECLNYNVTVNVNDATGTITFTIDGNDTVVPIVNGVAVYTFADLTQGVYKINISYSGDDKYFANETNVTINVAPNRNVEITADNATFDKVADKYSAVFKNYQGNPIANAVVIFTIGNETYKTLTDENGKATIDLSLLRGKYDVVVAFEATDDFDAANATATIIVSDKTSISLDSISTTSIVGTLKDANGNPLAGETIVYTIAGGNKLKTTTDANGSFKIQVDKNGLVVIGFEGDEISEPCSTSIKLDGIVPEKKVSPKTTKVASKFVAKNKKFKAKKKTKKYVVKLKTSTGKAIKNVKVTLKIKGKKYQAKTNAKGNAVFKIKKLTKKGTYKAKITFAGNKLYKAASKTVKIIVRK